MKNPLHQLGSLFRFNRTVWLAAAVFLGVGSAQAQLNMWSGAGTATGITNWSYNGNWSGGALVQANSALFANLGAATTVSNINNTVDVNETITQLIYATTNTASTSYMTTLITNGVTLTVTNTQGTNLVYVGTATDNGVSQVVDATITGPLGTLNVVSTNVASAMQMQQGSSGTGTHDAILDMSGLGTFNLTAGRLLIAASPASGINASNYLAGQLNLAYTNMIQLNGTTSPQLIIGDAISNPNSIANLLELGQTNSIYVDNMTVGRGKQTGNMKFNPSLAGNSPMLYLRGKSAATVTTLAIADNGTQTGTSSSSIGTLDLSLGTVNALVNTCILGRGQINSASTGGANGTLNLSAGVFNVNIMDVGVVNTNNAAYTVLGAVNVNGTATLIVNADLALGVNPNTSATNTALVKSSLNITNGTVLANAITSPSASGNQIIANINVNNGWLTISNSAGTSVARLASVNLTSAALHFIGNPSVTNIITTNMTGTATITLDSIGYGGGTVTYPLISYLGNDPYSGLTLGSLGAYTGMLVDNTGAKRIDLQITSGPITPILGSIVWGGGVNNNWDTTSLNWTNGSVTTVYADADLVNFNDLGRTGNINLGIAIVPGSVTVANSALAYTISGSGTIGGVGALTKTGNGILTLNNTNSYGGYTSISGGTLYIGSPSAIPPASAVNFSGASNATLNLQGLSQTLANLITTNNAVTSSFQTITGPSGSALTVSPALLTLSPFHVTNTVNLNLFGLNSFTYSNTAGTMEVRVGVVSPGGVDATGSGVQTTVTLAGGANTITAGSLNVGNNSPAGNTPIAQMNLGTNNTFNVNTINLGSGRGGDTVQFATNVTGGTLNIYGAGGPGTLATVSYAGHDSFEANDTPLDLFDASAGTLNAQFNTMTIGRDSPTASMTANRGINGSSTFKMGAGTLTASSITMGVIASAANDNGSFYYTLTNTSLFSLSGGTATITNLTLANNNYAGNFNPATDSKLVANFVWTNGATLNAASIQEGAIASPNSGTLNVFPQLIWGDGTLANIAGGGLTVNGVFFELAGPTNTHNLNISSGQTAQINAWITGTGTLTDNGAGTVILDGENSWNGALVMNSTNELYLGDANTYTGNTVINAGTLYLNNSGALNSPDIIVGSNGVFDVSSVAPFTLGENTNQDLSGFGGVNGDVIANIGAGIIPGGVGVPGTLTFSNDLTLNNQTIVFDLSSSPTGNNDLINIGGTLNMYANATIWINMLNGTLSPGTYTLITYSALSQNGYNFELVAPRGMTLNVGANALTLVVTTVSSASLTWVGDGYQNNWDVQTTTNWLNDGSLDYFYQLDNVTFNDSGSASPSVNLTTALVPSSVTVNAAQNYTFTSYSGGQLVGSMNLLKEGTGTLFLQVSNAYTGTTTVSNGTVELDTLGAAGSGPINVNSVLNVNLGANYPVSTLANAVNGPGTINVITTPYYDTILDGSLANFSGTIQVPADLTDTAEVDITSPTVNISSNATIYVTNGGTFFASGSGVIIAATNDVSGPGNANNLGALRVDGGAVISGRVNLLGDTVIGENTIGTISGVIGDGGVGYGITAVGSGTNTLYLLATNTYTGGTTISNGILSLGNGVINGTLPLTPGSVTNYGTLQFDVPTNVTVTPTYNIQGAGMVSKLSDGILWLTVSNSFSGGVTTGNGTGNGTSGGIIYLLNPYGFGNGYSSDLMETVSVQRTEVRLEGGFIMASNIYLETSANSALTTAGSGYVAFHNLSGTNIIPNNVELVTGAGNSEYSSDGGLLVFDGTILLGTASARTAVFSGAGVGLVNGAITNWANALSIQKNGTGTWTFAGANLYNGTTTVSGGTLLVNGSTSTNTVTVQTGTLGGSGTIGGAVTLQTGGIIQGGDGNLANTLTVPTLNLGNTGTTLTYSHFMVSSGGTVSATTLNVSGTNIVQILDPSLTVGTNTLFTYTGSIGGSSGFAGFQLGSLPNGVAAQLLDTGSAVQLAVTSVTMINTNSPVLGSSISGGTLNLSWPADHEGWRLEVQTNSLSTGLSNNWFTWPNSTTETSVAIPVDPASPTVYFRLVYP